MMRPRDRWSLGLLGLAMLFAGARWALSIYAIPVQRLQFANLHDVAWDRETHTLTRTGNDPYVMLALPPAALPVRRATFVFRGYHIPTEGTYYFFQTPTLKPGEQDHGAPLVGEVAQHKGVMHVSRELQDSTTLRLDFPDFLLRPLELRRVILATPYIRGDSWSLRLAAFFFAAALVAFVLPLRRRG